MCVLGTVPQRAGAAGAPLPFRMTNSAGSQQVLLSGAVLVLTDVFQGSPDVVGLLTAPSPAAGIWLLKGNFPASRPHTRTAAWVILLQKHLH